MANPTRPDEPNGPEPDYTGAEPLAGSGFETEEAESYFTDSFEGTED
jgi:hypothetical protein